MGDLTGRVFFKGGQTEYKGWISRDFTVWCGGCTEWQQVSTRRETDAAKEFRVHGWKLTKHRGWLCPNCMKNGPRNVKEAAHE
ncbi:hypothetical protein [Paenibacillus sp. RUD330]|uniref:hypothetical protein n=1 Tax=Paenibacillus sp. RUD330 TaxID=2023772 RepID=UPI000B92B743|nr:hypothetical protein [Paenibacillus sp. RUD330]ASS66239.1 hypothetical protein CIC07_08805 [Paenibacillus sp. RUD330]